MNRGRTIFAQVMQFIPHKEFARCVGLHLNSLSLYTILQILSVSLFEKRPHNLTLVMGP